MVLSLWQRDCNHIDSYRVSTVDVPTAAQEVHDSSKGVTPCIVMKNEGFFTTKCFMQSLKTFLCTTTILIQERCSSFINMVLWRSHYPYESQCSTHCSTVDWQSTVAAGCTNSSNSPCSCPQSWQLSNSPSPCDSSVANTFYPTFVFNLGLVLADSPVIITVLCLPVIVFFYFVILGAKDDWNYRISDLAKTLMNWYLTAVVNFGEVKMAQLAKSTLLTSTLVLLRSLRSV